MMAESIRALLSWTRMWVCFPYSPRIPQEVCLCMPYCASSCTLVQSKYFCPQLACNPIRRLSLNFISTDSFVFTHPMALIASTLKRQLWRTHSQGTWETQYRLPVVIGRDSLDRCGTWHQVSIIASCSVICKSQPSQHPVSNIPDLQQFSSLLQGSGPYVCVIFRF